MVILSSTYFTPYPHPLPSRSSLDGVAGVGHGPLAAGDLLSSPFTSSYLLYGLGSVAGVSHGPPRRPSHSSSPDLLYFTICFRRG